MAELVSGGGDSVGVVLTGATTLDPLNPGVATGTTGSPAIGTIDNPFTPPGACVAIVADPRFEVGDWGEFAPARGRGGSVEVFGGESVIVDWSVGDTVWIVGSVRSGVVDVAGVVEERPLGEKEKSVPGFVGAAVDAGEDNVVGPRLNVSFMLSCEETAADAAVAGAWDEIRRNVSPLWPLVVAATGIGAGAGVVEVEAELLVGVVLLVDCGRVAVTVIITVV